MPEELNGAEAPIDDIRADIAAAFDADVEAQTDEPTEGAPEAPESTDGRPRDELGRFAPKGEEKPVEAAPEPVKEQAPTEQPVAPIEGQQGEQPAKLVASPPPGWSVAAKSQFDVLPDAVKQAVAKREEEISNGFAKLAEYKGLDPIVDFCRQAGKQPTEVFAAYRAAEQMLADDPINGILEFCRMYGVHPAQLAGQVQGMPDQNGMAQPQGFDPRLLSYTQALESRQRTLEQRWAEYERMQEQQEQSAVESEIESFGKQPEHRYFENVKQTMGRLISIGAAEDLKDAYQQACYATPEIREVLIKEDFAKHQLKAQAEAKAKSEQAKRTSKSLPTGAPITGASRAGSPNATLRDDLEAAWDEAAA
jgi:hypothetical protein